VFMILGQSAATVAVMSLNEGKDIHELEYNEIRDKLLADGEILEY